MTSSYFSTFPKIRYFGTIATNITARAIFQQRLKEIASVYYPFVIEDGDTADNIAAKYYGDSNFDWLVYMTNDIIDPYTQWPKTQLQFDDYIIKKYGSRQAAQASIVFYRKKPEIAYINNDGTTFSTTNPNSSNYNQVETYDDIRITPETYATVDNPSDYSAIDAYEYEIELNEAKRHILLIDDSLADKIYNELRDLMNAR